MNVEKTALNQIINFIKTSNLRPMIKWSSRSIFGVNSSGYRVLNDNIRKIKKDFQNILNLISGNDPINMLKSNIKFHLFIKFLYYKNI